MMYVAEVDHPALEIAPDWVDEFMAPRGPCGMCGGPDARHRVLDAMVSCVRGGDSTEAVAEDYGYPVEMVNRLIKENWPWTFAD